MRKKSSTKDVTSLLPGLVRAKGWEVELERYDVFRNWEKLLGEEVAGCSAPLKVERNILWVEVENSVWLQQLQYQKAWMLDEINAFLKLSSLADIKLLIKSGRPKEEKEETRIDYKPPAAAEFEKFKEKTAWIEDEASREALQNFWYLFHACKRK
ncbi:DUF721 domain-containing protein [Desulfotalea psychrophila]|uniref:DUF721 domain-containing protein n=1 Tax=Desulfotalea psychrophila (strain LSv54 / DSM 12343) TaxID=177439 RepID=Q6APR3_DESPS|nr:DUF721 domain-containing protein [Desulfotalea psychrophila]CAG35661.1 unknown protein [Desulfotalea psychrophila LSv54]